MCNSNDLIVSQTDGLPELPEQITGCGSRAADDIHVEMDINATGIPVRIIKRLDYSVDTSPRTQIPCGGELRTSPGTPLRKLSVP